MRGGRVDLSLPPTVATVRDGIRLVSKTPRRSGLCTSRPTQVSWWRSQSWVDSTTTTGVRRSLRFKHVSCTAAFTRANVPMRPMYPPAGLRDRVVHAAPIRITMCESTPPADCALGAVCIWTIANR